MSSIAASPKIKYLFELYAQNWMAVKQHPFIRITPDEDNVFLCPLCLNYFTHEVLQDTNILSLEHVPPKSLGGTDRTCTLTCKKCNNEAGRKFEAQLKTRLEIDDALARIPGTALEVKYSPIVQDAEEIWLVATYQNEADGIALLGDPKRSDPRLLSKVADETFMEQVSGFRLRFKVPSQRRMAIALLKTAYLYIFRMLGYSALMTTQMQTIRSQIQNPEDMILDGTWLKEFPFSNDTLGVNAIYEPDEFRSWLVVLDLDSGRRQRRFGVFLPAPHDAHLRIHAQLSAISRGTTISFEGIHIAENERFLADPANCFYAYNLWKRTDMSDHSP